MKRSSNNGSVHKPLPLKQRTSSVDARRDYSASTWYSVLGLLKVREYFITVDHFSIWRRHISWGQNNGKLLRDYMTQRYSSSMVFMSLLLSIELNILFNSSVVTTNMRNHLANEAYWEISFWVGIAIIVSAVLTLLSLISTFTAWAMVSAVDEHNAHCVFRSSIGQYVAELPGRLIVGAIYTFIGWVILFLFILLPFGFWSVALVVLSLALFIHIITAFSAFGRIIMHSGAMGHQRIFEESFERNLLPHSLHAHLLAKARENLSKNTSILRQYRHNAKPIDHFYSEEELTNYLNEDISERSLQKLSTPSPTASSSSYQFPAYSQEEYTPVNSKEMSSSPDHPRRRADSLVRFADEISPPKPPQGLSRENSDSPTFSDTASSLDGGMLGDSTHSNKAEEATPNTRLPPRPSLAKREISKSNRSRRNDDTTTKVENRDSKSKLPQQFKTPQPSLARIEVDSGSSWTHDKSRPSITGNQFHQKIKSLPSAMSNGSAQPVPSISAMHRWRSSASSLSVRPNLNTPKPQQSPPSTGQTDSPFDNSSLQQVWLSSSTKLPNFDHAHTTPTIANISHKRPASYSGTISRPNDELPESSPPRIRSGAHEGNAFTESPHVLTEEDEAYVRDYGSFEKLRTSTTSNASEVLEGQNLWRGLNNHQQLPSSENDALLKYSHSEADPEK